MRPEAIQAAIKNLPKGSQKGRKQLRINTVSIAKLMSALMEEPAGLTYEEMQDVCGLSYTVVKDYVMALSREKAIYIAAWVEDGRGGRTRKQFALGINKKDAPRPGARCAKERAVKYRDRKRQAKLLGLPSVRQLQQGAAA
jgi:hypothetical protein